MHGRSIELRDDRLAGELWCLGCLQGVCMVSSGCLQGVNIIWDLQKHLNAAKGLLLYTNLGIIIFPFLWSKQIPHTGYNLILENQPNYPKTLYHFKSQTIIRFWVPDKHTHTQLDMATYRLNQLRGIRYLPVRLANIHFLHHQDFRLKCWMKISGRRKEKLNLSCDPV